MIFAVYKPTKTNAMNTQSNTTTAKSAAYNAKSTLSAAKTIKLGRGSAYTHITNVERKYDTDLNYYVVTVSLKKAILHSSTIREIDSICRAFNLTWYVAAHPDYSKAHADRFTEPVLYVLIH